MLTIRLDKRFLRQAKGVYERYEFEVGVLQDRAHNLPGKGLKSYAGGPARKTSLKSSGMSISEVSESLRKHTGVNFYTKPFSLKKNAEILKFTHAFLSLAGGKGQVRRVENLLQAVVRNPILRGDYGKNTATTAKIKGFNRFMIDTAQLFKNITARVKVRSVQG